MPKTTFADSIKQTATHLLLCVGDHTIKVPLKNVLSVRQRDNKSFRAVNPMLASGTRQKRFFDVLYHYTTITASFSAHAVSEKPDATGLIPVTATDGSITHIHPDALHVEPYSL
jgi:hypothetical protein